MPRQKEKIGAPPGWMTTMSDMNTLLMVFFIMLFSLLSWTKPLYVEIPGGIPGKHAMPEGTVQKDVTEEATALAQALAEAIIQASAGTPVVLQLENQYARVELTPDGVEVSIGGEFNTFEEGSARLQEGHFKILDSMYLYARDRSERMLIRGYAAANLPDALVFDGQAWHPWEAKDGDDAADWRALAYFRAIEAARYLSRPRPKDKPIRADRIIVQSEGAWGTRRARRETLTRGGLDLRRGERTVPTLPPEVLQELRKDRRVSIVITP